MLKISLDGDILTVIETIYRANETYKHYLYINVKTWHKNGQTLKIDDVNLDYKMVDNDIEWCKKYYFPKLTELEA